MNTPAKLVAFAGVLALLLGGGALAGAAIGPERDGEEQAATATTTSTTADHGHGGASEPAATETETETKTSGEHGAADPVRGLATAENGLRLVVEDPELRPDRPQTLRFRIVEAGGATVRDFDVEHTKRMHVIVARRDLTGFQHLHPEQRRDGSWTTRVTIDDPGSYRLFADFSREDEAHTLAADLRVDGPADLRPLPAATPTAVSDGGYDVRLDAGTPRPGQEAELRFTITQDGHTVHTEPYLGAGGHLVALREGDLAFLHVHPTEQGEGHDDSVGFAATFPTAGRYRLFLQFQHEGRVHTVAFTQEVPAR